MKSPSLKDKTSYFAKVRAANYADSLRLEGFDVASKGARKPVTVVAAAKKPRHSQG